MLKPTISIDEFSRVEMRVGKVVEVVDVAGSEKLYRMTVDLGQEYGTRIIYAGVKAWYKRGSLKNKLFIFVANLAPKKMMGQESQGMMLAVCETDEKPLLLPAEGMPVGAKIR